MTVTHGTRAVAEGHLGTRSPRAAVVGAGSAVRSRTDRFPRSTGRTRHRHRFDVVVAVRDGEPAEVPA
ncbi:hypothetical protein AB0G02_36655 [Actinosynnema sp. NPDC023658]|uniref:hypothetical protein n=1 Tax=Actinosynnema sp. NPDC023658 TaxID=3155465 RepID=UPI0033F891E8